ncbi:NYN domain-containing protein [Cronbergia sp. UHCC 0137]|uniref:NYN domain-containing protein n=1 Tax=Cronbergia sp. UHCC 0137 TaxID=3110239 RepID=UPI002B20E5A0|nr:NYN domain-containing protein [Cronbergia sp. UHCC 0137]MEA5619486.1 NYN domain-containing protein [Cronbergia sp. UHCC 0137]
MPNYERLLTTYDSTLLNKAVSYVCQAIITIQRQHPELLLEKYRSVQWENHTNQSALSAKFTKALSQTQDWDELLQKLELYLRAILTPTAFTLPIVLELITKIQQLSSIKPELNGSINSQITIPRPAKPETGIAILLLDAENLQINLSTEKFLNTVCTAPIQVKIAFANWSNRGKLDVELHERGYDLIHVPIGKDNADGKMIAYGSSIHERYPNVQEVLVCSSDKVMTNLRNNLQQHGLIVYQVSQQGDNISLFNSRSGETTIYSLKPLPEMPSIEELILQLKALIKSEQQRTRIYWVKLSVIAKLFKNKYTFNISQVISLHLPGKRARDIFINHPTEFVTHQIDDGSELYVTLFEHDQIQSETKKTQSEVAVSITSARELEQVLKDIMINLIQESQNSWIDISILGSKFNQLYGKSITSKIKELKISSSYVKFLQSCGSLQLQQKDKKWVVSC